MIIKEKGLFYKELKCNESQVINVDEFIEILNELKNIEANRMRIISSNDGYVYHIIGTELI